MISEIVGVVVSTSDEKKAPPYMERLQKEHSMNYVVKTVNAQGKSRI